MINLSASKINREEIYFSGMWLYLSLLSPSPRPHTGWSGGGGFENGGQESPDPTTYGMFSLEGQQENRVSYQCVGRGNQGPEQRAQTHLIPPCVTP